MNIFKKDDSSTIRFKTKLLRIGQWTILRLDKNSSAKLSSRGLVMVEGTINKLSFQTTLEPDGKKSHWFEVDKNILTAIKVKAGDTVELIIKQNREFSEPKVPADIKKALAESLIAKSTWKDITAFARWEWIRWIGATKSEDTRRKRIGVALSKLNKGDRRPCCFNSNQCTVPYLSHNGVLLEPEQVATIQSKLR